MRYTNAQLKHYSDRLSLLGWIPLKLLVPGIVIVGVVYFLVLVLSPEYKITVAQSPKSLAETGMTNEIVGQMFAAEITHLQDLSNTRIHNRFLTAKPLIDFKIPKTAFSFQTLVDWTKSTFRHPDTVVSIGLTQEPAGTTIHLTLSDPAGHTRFLPPVNDETVETAIKKGALEALRTLDPLVSGTAILQMEENTCAGTCTIDKFADPLRDLKTASQDADWKVAYRAYVSMSHIFAVTNHHDVAIMYAENAESAGRRAIDKLGARLLRSVERTALLQHELATDDYSYVIQAAGQKWLQPGDRRYLLSFAYQDWAADLVAQAEEKSNAGDQAQKKALYQQAADKFKRALEYNQGNDVAMRSLSRALWLSDQETEAKNVLENLLQLQPSDPQLHKDYANVLRYLQEDRKSVPAGNCQLFGAAINQFKIAITLAHAQQLKQAEAEAYLDLGKTEMACQDYAAARDNVQRALDAVCDYGLAAQELNRILVLTTTPPASAEH